MADEPDHDRMGRDLKSITDRLKDLRAELDDRKPVVDDQAAHVIDMNPLTPPSEEE